MLGVTGRRRAVQRRPQTQGQNCARRVAALERIIAQLKAGRASVAGRAQPRNNYRTGNMFSFDHLPNGMNVHPEIRWKTQVAETNAETRAKTVAMRTRRTQSALRNLSKMYAPPVREEMVTVRYGDFTPNQRKAYGWNKSPNNSTVRMARQTYNSIKRRRDPQSVVSRRA